MYKSIIYFSISKNLDVFDEIKNVAHKYNFKALICSSVLEFFSKYDKCSIVVYNEEEQDIIKKIKKTYPFFKIKFVEFRKLSASVISREIKGGVILNRYEVASFLNKIHIYPTSLSAIIIKNLLKNAINYGCFNYKILTLTCIQIKLNPKTELTMLRKYINDWYEKEKGYLLANFGEIYNFEKISIINFVDCAICHISKELINLSKSYYYNCLYYIRKMYGNNVYKVKKEVFIKKINGNLPSNNEDED